MSLGLLAAVLAIGPRGQRRAPLDLVGPAVFQPSELAKLSLAIWAAALLRAAVARRARSASSGGPSASLGAGLRACCSSSSPTSARRSPSLLMLVGMLRRRGTPARVLAPRSCIACAAGVVAIWMEPYSRARFFAFLHPWHDAQGPASRSCRRMIGMGSGGIFGVGLGQGVQKIFYLPEAHTDMMLANIGEELGLVGVAARDRAPTRCSPTPASTSRCAAAIRSASASPPGLTVLSAARRRSTSLAVMGAAPLTGIPLPFLSYGGSSLVVLLAGGRDSP